MKLVDLKVSEFMQVLGSNEPAPGGGSASALAAAMGISLTKMVCELTVGKKKYVEFETDVQVCLDKTIILQEKLLKAIDDDTEAFNVVSAVFSMPKETDEERVARQKAMQNALKVAAKSPLDLMEIILDALNTTKSIIGKSNTNAASDLGVAALNLKSGLQGAYLNVLINLSSIKDDAFVSEYKASSDRLLETGIALADDIYEQILKTL
ncbi:sugar ABC transporter substrate-binding protein [Granulicatella sp. zg-ZJ]|uniref:cyclodeaminase/cyclohydrolase family protein n=1 Tax=unclassified Granulicatella TaxID=2630493 RepID=UPI0013C239FF|nr:MULTISPECIES: cyclodeaminase/cyclohydrolase family protein [unclassified Granulicatella]NEW63368.1 sugar ABC transporter substrate-binding protein [Granulicatella sp. zg-ZJ]NEW66804.1 sugar ABC transporter substrate-binding protein [Granulicatella sp. zg-84]QMI85484.1 cyclodeaminase/cyclohydrolase family protein [Carnobacteriaceae bacterium zg-84]